MKKTVQPLVLGIIKHTGNSQKLADYTALSCYEIMRAKKPNVAVLPNKSYHSTSHDILDETMFLPASGY